MSRGEREKRQVERKSGEIEEIKAPPPNDPEEEGESEGPKGSSEPAMDWPQADRVPPSLGPRSEPDSE